MEDIKRQDKNTHSDALEFTQALQKECGAPDDVLAAQEGVCKLKGTIQGTNLRFKSDAVRMVSGQSGTIKFNSMRTSANVVDRYGEPGPTAYAALVVGDDNSMIGLASVLLAAGKPRLGYTTTAEIGDCKWDFNFCSNRPYPSADGSVMAPCIGRVFAYFGHSAAPIPDVYGAACGLMATVAHVPFLFEYVDAHRQLSRKIALPAARVYAIRAKQPHAVSPEVWAFLQHVYGLSRDELPGLVNLLRSIRSLPAVIPWSSAERVIRRDV
jgi:hypothetical protein